MSTSLGRCGGRWRASRSTSRKAVTREAATDRRSTKSRSALRKRRKRVSISLRASGTSNGSTSECSSTSIRSARCSTASSRSEAVERGGDSVERIAQSIVDRIDVAERFGDIEASFDLVRRAERAAKAQSLIAAAAAVSLRSVECDAARGPPRLPSKVDVVPPDLANDRRDLFERFDDERIDSKHLSLLALALAKAKPPQRGAQGRSRIAKQPPKAARPKASSVNGPSTALASICRASVSPGFGFGDGDGDGDGDG